MAGLDLSTLAARLAHLERRHVRLKRFVLAGVVAFSGLLALAVAEPRKAPTLGGTYPGKVEKILAAESFTVADQAGHIRAVLGHTPAGTPALQLMGEDGRSRATMAAVEGSSGIVQAERLS